MRGRTSKNGNKEISPITNHTDPDASLLKARFNWARHSILGSDRLNIDENRMYDPIIEINLRRTHLFPFMKYPAQGRMCMGYATILLMTDDRVVLSAIFQRGYNTHVKKEICHVKNLIKKLKYLNILIVRDFNTRQFEKTNRLTARGLLTLSLSYSRLRREMFLITAMSFIKNHNLNNSIITID